MLTINSLNKTKHGKVYGVNGVEISKVVKAFYMYMNQIKMLFWEKLLNLDQH